MFVTDTGCVDCVVQTRFSYIIQLNFSLQLNVARNGVARAKGRASRAAGTEGWQKGIF